MKVEQEIFARSSFLFFQRGRMASGTRRRMAWPKSPFTTTAAAANRSPPASSPTASPFVVDDPLHRSVQADIDAHLAGDIRHRLGDGAAAADRVKHAVLVFEKREDREQARALERRHAEIFRLE